MGKRLSYSKSRIDKTERKGSQTEVGRRKRSLPLIQFYWVSDKECDKPETIVIKDALDQLSGPMKDEDHVRGHQINMEVMDDAGAVRGREEGGKSATNVFVEVMYDVA